MSSKRFFVAEKTRIYSLMKKSGKRILIAYYYDDDDNDKDANDYNDILFSFVFNILSFIQYIHFHLSSILTFFYH